MTTISYTVEKAYHNKTVGEYLKYIKGISSRLIVKLKHYEYGITINGKHTRTIDSIKAGDLLELNIIDKVTQTKGVDIQVPILFEDEHLVIYNKPQDMVCHQSKRYQDNTLANVYAAKAGEGAVFRVINRLDKDTSGIVVVAKNMYAAAKMSGQVEKTYFAVASGVISGEHGIIEAPIARTSPQYTKRCVREDGQYAKTEYKVISRLDNYTVIRLKLYTGRTHQIRVHMSHMGYPLAGDDMYGGDMQITDKQALHCCDVLFAHPLSNETIYLKAPVPALFGDVQVTDMREFFS